MKWLVYVTWKAAELHSRFILRFPLLKCTFHCHEFSTLRHCSTNRSSQSRLLHRLRSPCVPGRHLSLLCHIISFDGRMG